MAGGQQAAVSFLTNIAKAAVSLGVGASVLNSSLYTVDGGQRAVLFDRFRGVLDTTVGEGTHFLIPLLQKPYIFDIRTRPHTFSSNSGTKDLQMVNLTLRLLSRPDVQHLPTIFKSLGTEYDEKVLPSIGNEVLKAVVAQFNADQLLTERPHVSALVRDSLVRRARDFNIVLDDVAITHLSYGTEFSVAVEKKQVAQQEGERIKKNKIKNIDQISMDQILGREGDGEREMAASHVEVPGEATQTSTALLETATGAIQSFAPINKIHEHLCAFHFYAHDITRQVEAHHYCSHQNEEMRQCLIYDSPESDARLIGIEYLISENLFLTLPDEEKPLWHSHEYEVKSGILFLPGIPGPVERKEMEKVCKTYGKTFHFWQVDRGDALPIGPPQLMMALTRDGQLHDHLAKDVEKKYGVSFKEKRESRAYMKGPEHGIHPLANGAGKGLKTQIREVDLPPVDSVPRIFV